MSLYVVLNKIFHVFHCRERDICGRQQYLIVNRQTLRGTPSSPLEQRPVTLVCVERQEKSVSFLGKAWECNYLMMMIDDESSIRKDVIHFSYQHSQSHEPTITSYSYYYLLSAYKS